MSSAGGGVGGIDVGGGAVVATAASPDDGAVVAAGASAAGAVVAAGALAGTAVGSPPPQAWNSNNAVVADNPKAILPLMKSRRPIDLCLACSVNTCRPRALSSFLLMTGLLFDYRMLKPPYSFSSVLLITSHSLATVKLNALHPPNVQIGARVNTESPRAHYQSAARTLSLTCENGVYDPHCPESNANEVNR